MMKDFYKGKKVLITGNTGFKGAWLCLMLDKLGADVYGYSLDAPTNPNLFEICNIKGFTKTLISDIRDYRSLENYISKIKPDIIFHLAAQSLVRKSYEYPIETYETNVMGTVNLLHAARNSESLSAIVNVTSDKCYENKEWIWPYRENESLGGYDPYSSSKACSEIVTSAFRNSFFNSSKTKIATARAGNVIGGGDFATDRLIPDFFKSLSDKKPITIRSPYSIRPWQYVLEPLSGYLMLGEALSTNGNMFAEAWNFGPDDMDNKNVEWIVKYLCANSNNKTKYSIDNNPQPHEASILNLDITKSKNILKWKPKWNLETALNKILDFVPLLENTNNIDNTKVLNLCRQQIDDYLNHE